MPNFDDPDFDPNAYLAQDPSEWDDDAHDLAIQGGLEDLVDKHVQATGQLPDQTQADAYLAQATQDQLPFMRNPDAGAPAQNGGTADDCPHLTFPMPPEPAHDHLEWSMPPTPDTPPAQDPSAPQNADTAPQADDTPPVPQPRPPQSPTDTQQADGAPPTPSPSTGQPGLKGPFISQKSGTELLSEANGHSLYTPRDLQNGNSEECTALTKYATGAPPTSQWAEGEKVTPQMLGQLKPGTAIATFTNGKYVNASGNHAAVVESVDNNPTNPSVKFIEQWDNQPPIRKTYYFNKPGVSRIHDMANYSVVMAR